MIENVVIVFRELTKNYDYQQSKNESAFKDRVFKKNQIIKTTFLFRIKIILCKS